MTEAEPRATRQTRIRRRTLLGAPLVAASGPWLLSGCSNSGKATTPSDLKPYQDAKINWKKADGAQINVAVIPATYFTDLIALLPQFTALTGIKVETEQIPPQKIRQNVVQDLSTGTGRYHTHAADPTYYPLYVVNKWVEPLDPYLQNSELCNPDWFDVKGIFAKWLGSTSIDKRLYGMPYDGEVTIQVYRKDLYKKAGITPAQTMQEFESNAAKLNDPSHRLWGTALRGLPGAGQNMYIFSSLFIEWGARWFDSGKKPTVNSPQAVEALTYYVNLLTKYAPTAVTNWNWPDIADAFARGTIASYIDANSSASVLLDPKKSTVIGKIAFDRWPKGPSGKRCTSIWNWSFPINASVSEKEKTATWLFIQWATCKETQIRTSYQYKGDSPRLGVNRKAIMQSSEYAKANHPGDNYIQASLTSLEDDTVLDWRPRVPQWPAIGDKMATLVQSALTKQLTPKAALDQGQAQIEKIMKGASS